VDVGVTVETVLEVEVGLGSESGTEVVVELDVVVELELGSGSDVEVGLGVCVVSEISVVGVTGTVISVVGVAVSAVVGVLVPSFEQAPDTNAKTAIVLAANMNQRYLIGRFAFASGKFRLGAIYTRNLDGKGRKM